MEGVMENSLARCKRKAECGLEKEATKRPKIGPTVLPPARKPGGFMQSIQLPGHVAAMPTNIKHVREVVRAPCASQPHKSCHKSASPKMPETNEESRRAKNEERVASSKKRSFEDDTEKRVSKKAKVCHHRVRSLFGLKMVQSFRAQKARRGKPQPLKKTQRSHPKGCRIISELASPTLAYRVSLAFRS